MFNFKTKLLSAIFACLLFASPASAEYFSDVILTGTQGIWMDSRSYASLQHAITAAGAADREIVIIGAQAATTLVVPANIRLKFLRDGSINNTGQLTINTRNIVAEDRQIFTGAGDIDFIDGSVVRSSWFSNAVEALDVTLDDSLTMIISEPGHVTANTAVGNDVALEWESSDNQLIVYGGRVLSNVKNLEADNYQIFAGAGDIDFLDGTELYLSWFRRLRSALTWVETEEVTIFVNEDSTVDYTQVSSANESIKFISGNILTLSAGITLTLNGATEVAPLSFNIPATAILTLNGPIKCKGVMYAGLGTLNINGPFECGRYQAFPGTGTLAFGAGSVGELFPQWWQENTIPGTTDMTVAIQAAIDAGIDVEGGLVILVPDTYLITDTLHLGRGNGTFDTVSMSGTAMSHSGQGVTIDASSFLDRPAVNIQGARGIELANVYILGGNIAPVTAGSSDVEADYITIGATYGRYNPYAGVAIDAYSGAQPGADFYPGTYGMNLSSGVTLTNVHIEYFVIGVTNHPCDSNSQGDDIVLNKCRIDYCEFGYGVHGTQNRGNYLNDCEINYCRTGVITYQYGPQNGAAPGIAGGVWTNMYRVFDVGVNVDLFTIQDLYVEGLQTVGILGRTSSSANKPVVIEGSFFDFYVDGALANEPPIANIRTNGPVVFNGCNFELQDGIFNIAGSRGNVVFNASRFRTTDTWNDQFYIGRVFGMVPPHIEMNGCTYRTDLYATSSPELNSVSFMANIATPNRLNFTPASRLVVDYQGTYKYVRGSGNSYTASAVVGIAWADADTVTFTATTAAEFMEDDILFWKTGNGYFLPAMKIVDITGAVVTADAIFDPADYDAAWAPLFAYIVQREWAPGIPCTGDTHTNFTVDGVVGVAALRIGDFLKGSADIPANTRITNIVGNVVTISKAATGTTVGINLYFAQAIAL